VSTGVRTPPWAKETDSTANDAVTISEGRIRREFISLRTHHPRRNLDPIGALGSHARIPHRFGRRPDLPDLDLHDGHSWRHSRRIRLRAHGTPNRSDLEEALCELENASFAAAVNSGTSAEVAVFSALLGPGDEIIIPRDVYGGTFRLLKNEYERWGVRIRTVDLTDTSALAEAINERTAIVWVETPSNPGLDIVDIAAT